MINKLSNEGLNQESLGGDLVVNDDLIVADAGSDSVGVGIATPASQLHIHESSGSNSAVHITNTTSGSTASDGLKIYTDGSNAGFLNRESGFSVFGTGTTATSMYVTSQGRIGMGVQAPDNAIHIVRDSDAVVKLDDSTATVGGLVDARVDMYGSDALAGTVGFKTSAMYLQNQNGNLIVETVTGGYINFKTGGSERVRIASDGKVGIGTSSPTEVFTVLGDSAMIGGLEVGTNNRVWLDVYSEVDTAKIASTFSGANTDKLYVRFRESGGSTDPGYIVHETQNSGDTNESVLHLAPGDDNAYGDYVSIHGVNQTSNQIKLHTSGRIETVDQVHVGTSGVARRLSSIEFCTPTRHYNQTGLGATTVTIDFSGTVGGLNTAGAEAVICTFIVDAGTADGSIVAYRYGDTAPSTQTIIFDDFSNEDLANTTFVQLDSLQRISVKITGGGNIGLICDVLGFVFYD